MTSLSLAAHCRRLAADAEDRGLTTLAERHRQRAREFEREAKAVDGIRAMWARALEVSRRGQRVH